MATSGHFFMTVTGQSAVAADTASRAIPNINGNRRDRSKLSSQAEYAGFDSRHRLSDQRICTRQSGQYGLDVTTLARTPSWSVVRNTDSASSAAASRADPGSACTPPATQESAETRWASLADIRPGVAREAGGSRLFSVTGWHRRVRRQTYSRSSNASESAAARCSLVLLQRATFVSAEQKTIRAEVEVESAVDRDLIELEFRPHRAFLRSPSDDLIGVEVRPGQGRSPQAVRHPRAAQGRDRQRARSRPGPGQDDQGRPVGAAAQPGQPDRQAGRDPALDRAQRLRALPRLPAQGVAAADLHPAPPRGRGRTRPVDRLGSPMSDTRVRCVAEEHCHPQGFDPRRHGPMAPPPRIDAAREAERTLLRQALW